jgi:hypothetical protein
VPGLYPILLQASVTENGAFLDVSILDRNMLLVVRICQHNDGDTNMFADLSSDRRANRIPNTIPNTIPNRAPRMETVDMESKRK